MTPKIAHLLIRASVLALVLCSACATGPIVHPGDSGLVAPGAVPVRLARGFTFTEGPATDPAGDVYFTDIPKSRIHKWSFATGRVVTALECSGGANGLAFDREGRLVICEGSEGRVAALDEWGVMETLAGKFEDRMFNSPNDCWVDPKNGIYFTDPRYGPIHELDQGWMYVYYISPDHKTVTRVVDSLVKPNGIVGTADGKTLYIADEGGHQTWAYDIEPDGSLTGARLFAPERSDGMTLDERGNVYLTNKGVVIYSPAGEKLETIKFPMEPANLKFAGHDRKTLFVTAQKAVYGLRMNVRGQ